MARVLATTVVLSGEGPGHPVVLLAGETPTDEQAEQITNPKAWADEADVEEVADDAEVDDDSDDEDDEDSSDADDADE